jgi:hypothetical protein
MTSIESLSVIAAWFVLGQGRIVLTSKMAEHRIDISDPSQALGFTRAAAAARRNAANYDARGQRLLPWYLAIASAYWILVVGIACWLIYHA